MKSRVLLFAASAASTLLASHVLAQTPMAALAAAAEAADASTGSVAELVVTGSRAEPRSRLETVAPVDVVSNTQLARGGTTELAQALSFALPSLNFTRPAV